MSIGSSAASGSQSGWEPPSVEELQALLPQYEIESMIGHGGMGAVYRGKQVALHRPVAIKLLPETLAEDDSGGNFVERFKLEARSMASLDHPAIISVHDFGQTSEGHLYFVMEFIDGMDMQKYIQLSGGNVDADTAVAIVSHVLDALDYAHSKGIVHRDIKPANVLINREGKVKIADFGLAKKLTGEEEPAVTGLTMSNVALGTPDFIAPEALDSDATPDHRADLYAVGVMLYQMLTGKVPRGIFKLPSEENSELDSRIDDILTLAMEADPGGRFQSATEFRLKLDELASAPVEKITPEVPTDQFSAPAEQLDFTEPGLRKSESMRRHPPGKMSKKSNPAKAILWTVLASLVVGGVLFWWIADPDQEEQLTGLDTPPNPIESKPEKQESPEVQVTEVPKVAAVIPEKAKPGMIEESAPATSSNEVATEDSPEKPSPPEVAKVDTPDPVPEPVAPAVEAVPSIPEFISRIEAFQRTRQSQLSDLLEKYRFALAGAEKGAIGAGELSQVEAVQAAINRADALAAAVAKLPGTETVEPLPALPPLGSGAPDDLKRLRSIFDSEVAKIENGLFQQLRGSLEVVQKELVKANRIEDARTVEQWRNRQLGGVYSGPKEMVAGSKPVEVWTDLMQRDEWKSHGPDIWKEENGGFISAGKETAYLWRDMGFEEFELEGEVLHSPTGNGGVLFAVRTMDLAKRFVDSGFQFQVCGSAMPDQKKTGTLIPKLGRDLLFTAYENGTPDDVWTSFRIRFDKSKIIGELDGKPLFDVAIPAEMVGESGRIIGLEQMGVTSKPEVSGGKVGYRKLRIRPYSSEEVKAPAVTETQTQGWSDMFNGQNFDGWKIAGDKSAFSVENGILKAGKRNGPSLLYWTGNDDNPQTVKNFEMSFRARSEGTAANSGIYFHTDGSRLLEGGKWPEQGLEFQLAVETIKGLQATGGLYNVEAPRFEGVDTGEWKDYRILVEEKRVQSWVGSRRILDYTESDDLPPASPHQQDRISPVGGVISIQANSKNGAWYFEDLKIRTW